MIRRMDPMKDQTRQRLKTTLKHHHQVAQRATHLITHQMNPLRILQVTRTTIPIRTWQSQATLS